MINIEFDLVIQRSKDINLRQLEELRKDLFNRIQTGFSDNEIELYQDPSSRSLDPAVIGAIGLAISPILVEKLADLISEWMRRHSDCSITINMPIKGAKSLQIVYNPSEISPETLEKWIINARTVVESTRAKEKH